MIGEIARHVEDPDVIPLSAGYPALDLIPLAALRDGDRAAIERHGARAFQYGPIEGVGERAIALAELGRARGLDDDADSIVDHDRRPAGTDAGRARDDPARRQGRLRVADLHGHHRVAARRRRRGLPAAGRRATASRSRRSSSCCAATRSGCSRRSRACTTRPAPTSPPSGATRLVELAHRHGFFILEDAVYGDLRFEGARHGPLRALAPSHVIYVDSLSKTVGPGLRAGWVAASGPVLDRVIAEKRRDDAHGATLTQQTTAVLPRRRASTRRSSSCARERYRASRDVLRRRRSTPSSATWRASARPPAAATSG